MDDFCVVVGKGRNCNLDTIDRLIFVPEIRQLVKPRLHLVLDPVAEGLHAGHIANFFFVLLCDPSRILFHQKVLEEA